ncbi:beta strand repeat-containing protein [Mariniflexile sp.]|uniref:beta strand repeat-containing protein n=1 Tax=Mariniflexile sp. TaxID=1979402 RepID=UPI003566BB67
MKKVLLILLLMFAGFSGFSQTPGISYQAVILNPNTKQLPGANAQSNILANSKVFVQFTIINEFNSQEYQEYHQTTTDVYGMINLLIGHGTKTSFNSFNDVIWNGFSKKLKVEIDFSGKGNAYTLLSEQELTFMPQPGLLEDTEAILTNTLEIKAERDRAISAETALQTLIDQNIANVEAAIAISSSAIDAEIIRATNAEAAITGKFTTEISNLTNANTTLQANIETVQSDVDANETATNNAIAAVQMNVDANQTASELADTNLGLAIAAVQLDVDSNETATNNAISAVQMNVDANQTASELADTNLGLAIAVVQLDVDSNETATNNAIAAVQMNVDANQTASELADTNLGLAIAAVQLDVDSNEAATNNAIAAVQADVDSNELAVNNALDLKAALLSPNFTGIPTAPTAIVGTNTNQIATTEFVTTQSANFLSLTGGTLIGAFKGTSGTFSSFLDASSLTLRNATRDWGFGLIGDDLVIHQGGCCNRFIIDSDGRVAIGANYTPSYQLDVQGDGRFTSNLLANSFVKSGGTDSQFLKADGSVDSNEYLTTALATMGFVDLTTNQTIAGAKTFSNDVIVNGIKIGRGLGDNDQNTAIGASALGTGTGTRNTAIGYAALKDYAGTSFDNNTSVGYFNMPSLTTGDGNTSVGAESLLGLLTGSSNTSIGNQSLINTSGNNNVGVGKGSASTLTTGSNNTIIGTEANVLIDDQNNSTAIGFQAVASGSNTIQLGNGNVTLVNTSGAITSGAEITATSFVKSGGTSSQFLKADGSVDSSVFAPLASPSFTGIPLAPTAAVGTNTTQIATTAFVKSEISTATVTNNSKYVDLTSVQTITGAKTFSRKIFAIANSYANTAIMNIGFSPNGENLSSIAMGIDALKTHQYGARVIGIGNESLYNDLRGVDNIGMGYRTLFNLKDVNNDWGNGNIAIGSESGINLTTGDYNTLIGTKSNTLTSGISNGIAIGYQAVVNANNTIQLGNSSITDVKTSGAITAASFVRSGGTSSQFLMADGSVSAGSAPVREVADEFLLTGTQSIFTLSQTPSSNSKVKMYVNGIRISNTAYSVSGATLTYVPANNGGNDLGVNDRIQFDFYY